MCGRLTEGVSRLPPANLSGLTTEGATAKPATVGVVVSMNVGGSVEPTRQHSRQPNAAS